MIPQYISAYYEVLLFIAIEIFLIAAFLLFRRYSRNHGGAFDRRVGQRRSYENRITQNITGEMRLAAEGIDSMHIRSSSGNDMFDISIENFIEGRQNSDRRNVPDRRRR